MMNVRGQQIEPDIAAEMSAYEWGRAKWTGTRLIACSPFRDESTPSFGVNLDNGTWIDSGGEGSWHKGNFVQLLAYLRNETYAESEDYLLSLYSPYLGDLDSLKLSMNLTFKEETPRVFTEDDLTPFLFRHSYLEGRGIGEKVQRAFRIGFDKKSQAIAIPWFDRRGLIINFKFRSVKNKVFWYASGGQKIGNHIYGIHFVYRLGSKRVVIVESETDALYLWQYGIAAVALGGSNLSTAQRKLLIQSPAETFIIATDNDKQGRKAKRSIIEGLSGIKNLEEVSFPDDKKDVNELTPDQVKTLFAESSGLSLSLSFTYGQLF